MVVSQAWAEYIDRSDWKTIHLNELGHELVLNPGEESTVLRSLSGA